MGREGNDPSARLQHYNLNEATLENRINRQLVTSGKRLANLMPFLGVPNANAVHEDD
jgi:hypothetical protein